MQQWFNEYIEANKQEKEAKAIKARHRRKMEVFLRRCKAQGIALDGVSYDERSRFDINEEVMLGWIKGLGEDTYHKVVKETLDYEKLQNAILDGFIDISQAPTNSYETKTIPTITVKGK